MLRERDGACYAYCKGGQTSYTLARSEYPRLLADWMAGKAFWTGLALYGSTVTLKLGDIVAVFDSPGDALRSGLEDRAADAREDALGIE